eukprot:gene30454-55007_t
MDTCHTVKKLHGMAKGIKSTNHAAIDGDIHVMFDSYHCGDLQASAASKPLVGLSPLAKAPKPAGKAAVKKK